MNRIPCEVIRDLFPSYIEQLTSETTNGVIEEHLEGCEDCRGVLAAMKGGEPSPEAAQQEKKEIDYLKKNRKHNRKVVLFSLLGAAALFCAVVFLRLFIIGNSHETRWAAMNLRVEGKTVEFTAVPTDSASGIAAITFAEEDGVVTAEARSVLVSPFFRGNRAESYTAQEEITEFRIGDRIVWANGATVSPLASELFQAAHPYVGDMPANNRIALILGLSSYLGPFTNELETSKEPYGWKILLSEEISAAARKQKEQDMDAFGRVMVGLVGNLDHVTFVYTAEGEEVTRTITNQEASEFLGTPVHAVGQNVRLLDELIEKTGLSLYAMDGEQGKSEEGIWIRLRNESDKEILELTNTYYRDGIMTSSGGGENADGSAVKVGEVIWIDVNADNFGGSWDGDALLEVELSFLAADKTEMKVPARLRLTPGWGDVYDFVLTGNESAGYQIIQ